MNLLPLCEDLCVLPACYLHGFNSMLSMKP
jgi:hypothetical protein